jgi:hypothetical protein
VLGWAGVCVGAALVLAPAARVAADGNRNACGCYKSESGSCYCDKGAKCGCPGDCEPKGCEEKREKELEKEIQSETRRAQESARRQGGETESAPAPAPRPAPAKRATARGNAPAPKLTPKQSRELSRLLSIYVAEHPEASSKRVEDLVRELSAAP